MVSFISDEVVRIFYSDAACGFFPQLDELGVTAASC